jgi:hypothetical protein
MMIPGVPNELLFFGAALAAVVAIFVFARQYERKRDAAFRTAALHLGWRADGEAAAPPQEVEEFHLFQQGRARRASNLCRGRPGQFDATLFDYRYTTGSGRNSTTHKQTVLVFELSDCALPEFDLRPENLFHKIGSAFGYQDINLESRPEFSKAYLLRGTEEAQIRQLFRGELVHHLERNRGWSASGAGTRLLVYRAGKRVKPEDLRDFTRKCERIATLISRR